MAACAILAAAVGAAGVDRSIRWENDYATALARARRENRLLVGHFRLQGRPLVESMERETLSDPEVVRYSNENFLNVRIDAADKRDLFERVIGGRGGLATCIVDGGEDVVSMLPGYASTTGYLRFLKRAQAGYPALREARAQASRSKGDLGALALLAERYEGLQSLRRAEAEYERLASMAGTAIGNGGDARRYAALGHERLARFRAMRGRNREAAEQLRLYRGFDPSNRFGILDRALLTDAIVCWIERRLKDAATVLGQALRSFPSSRERDQMLLAAGTVRHETGDDPGALELLRLVQADYPSSAAAEQAAAQIEHIRNPPPDHVH